MRLLAAMGSVAGILATALWSAGGELPHPVPTAAAGVAQGGTALPAGSGVSQDIKVACSPAVTPAQIEADWLRQDELRGAAQSAKPSTQEDAAGGVDGIKNGKWGFHTEYEPNPWWQVDLGQPVALDRVVLYNRTELAERNNHIMVLLSTDGRAFQKVFQNQGTVFYGYSDQKPLVVPLGGTQARYVRLQLPGTSYFHLDEVEVYAVGRKDNIALHKLADQSSTSQWSVRHKRPASERAYPTAVVIERGRKLAAALRQLGARIDAEAAALEQAAERFRSLPGGAPEALRREVYFQARWAVRRLALANPLLNFDSILFVKRAPTMFPHMSDQHYGWWSRPGGGIYVLEGLRSGQARVRCLTSDMPEGNFAGPDISYDGRRVLFAYCRWYPHVSAVRNKVDKEKLPDDSFYHIYAMNVDGTGRRQLTRGRYDDFDPRWLPDGQVVFLSTRKGTAIQCGRASAAATEENPACPDSYVRCGGDAFRPVAVFTLHVMDSQGRNIRPISAFENFEWTPSVGRDGRIFYARWDYIDRFNGPFMSLWSTNPDGTNAQLVYGNFTVRPQCVFEARSIPNSHRMVFTASAHHSITGGSLVLLDRTRGSEFEAPLSRLTPEVVFPETEGWPEHYYANPYPLSEQFFLVAWSDRPLPPHTICTDDRNPVNASGIYLFDAFGNLELLHRDPAISSQYPLPIVSRPRPPVLPDTVAWQGRPEGRFLVQDVYRGLEGIPRGAARRLRIVAVPPKVQPNMNTPVLGVSAEDPGKFVLGTVPIESDGSAHFRVPAGVPVFFQVLDEKGLALQTMRTLTYVMPQQTQACIGCHEPRDTSPPVGKVPLAALKEPSRVTPGPPGSWPLRFDQLVQPVLDRACVRCHSPQSGNKGQSLDLTPERAYQSLISFGGEDLKKKAFERDRSVPGQCTAATSKLYALLTQPGGHEGVQLAPEDLQRLVLWMDTYAHRLGSFSPEQEQQLQRLRQAWSDLLAGP